MQTVIQAHTCKEKALEENIPRYWQGNHCYLWMEW